MKDPATDLGDAANFFGQRNELIGWDEPERWFLPAQQRLHPDYVASLEVALRLINQVHSPLVRRLAQLGFEHQTPQRCLVQRLRVVLETVAALGLGKRHGPTRLTQQRFAVLAVERVD